jgi:hypothetical protein
MHEKRPGAVGRAPYLRDVLSRAIGVAHDVLIDSPEATARPSPRRSFYSRTPHPNPLPEGEGVRAARVGRAASSLGALHVGCFVRMERSKNGRVTSKLQALSRRERVLLAAREVFQIRVLHNVEAKPLAELPKSQAGRSHGNSAQRRTCGETWACIFYAEWITRWLQTRGLEDLCRGRDNLETISGGRGRASGPTWSCIFSVAGPP